MNKRLTDRPDYRNRFNQDLWLRERQRDLDHYFTSRHIVYDYIESDPFWARIPLVSIWRVRTLGTPGFYGWYGIAGDHPCDIVGINNFSEDPRAILRHFARKWRHAAERLKNGEDWPEFRIEHIDERPGIGTLIEDRALRLQRWVEEDRLW